MPLVRFAYASIALIFGMTSSAIAGICDYRPSAVVGAVGGAAASFAVSGAALKAAGFYTLDHSVTGATMLASTAGGTSAAGTVGIMGGTGGGVGAVASYVMAPMVGFFAGALAVGSVGVELGCDDADRRAVIREDVLSVMQFQVSRSGGHEIQIIELPDYPGVPYLAKRNASGEFDAYNFSSLYIDDGRLMARQWMSDQLIWELSLD